MIGKEQFSQYIQDYQHQYKIIDEISQYFNGFWESDIVEYGWKMFDELLKAYFTEEGIDWIYYFLLENPNKSYYVNEERIPLKTSDDLWEIVKDYRI